MKAERKIMNHVRWYALEFLKRQYPDEVPYFDIAWKSFAEAIQSGSQGGAGGNKGLTVEDLKRPIVRDGRKLYAMREGDSTIMAPRIIQAFHILFTENERIKSGNNETLKQEILNLLTENRFSFDFSVEITNFFLARRYEM
ncbi:MAG: hypothetical protein HXS40_09565 [Theionarchaea archaeon]|nr:hypothetical protein [Theionarchaea archaeon]